MKKKDGNPSYLEHPYFDTVDIFSQISRKTGFGAYLKSRFELLPFFLSYQCKKALNKIKSLSSNRQFL